MPSKKNKTNIIIFGASINSKVIIDIIEKEEKYIIAGLIDKTYKKGIKLMDYPLIGCDKDIIKIIKDYNINGGVIGIGDNQTRALVYKKIIKLIPDFNFIKCIHPSAEIGKNVRIGEGTVIMAGAVINSDSSIGKFCILNTKASLDHDGYMSDFSSLAPGVTLGGNVRIGNNTAVSLGANVIHKIKIGNHSVIGAGALVVKDIPDLVVAYGVPAKIIRKRKKGDIYLR
ncbi:MAG: acetyltransferase [Bacteroidales bacterium]|nr:acetyltransferase [Bacteroidales bacterium]